MAKTDKPENEPDIDLTNIELDENGDIADDSISAALMSGKTIHSTVPEAGNNADNLDDNFDNSDEEDDLDLLDEDDITGDDEDSDDKDDKVLPVKSNFKTLEAAAKAHAEATKKLGQMGTDKAKLNARIKELEAGKAPEPAKPVVNPKDAIIKATAKKFAALKIPDAEDEEAVAKYNQDIAEIFADQSTELQQVETVKAKSVANTQVAQKKQIAVRLKDAGLSEYEDYFYNLAPSVPPSITTFEEAVEWGIGQINAMKAIATNSKDDEDADDSVADGPMPGGKRKGPNSKPKAKDEELPKSIGEAMAVLADRRRIK